MKLKNVKKIDLSTVDVIFAIDKNESNELRAALAIVDKCDMPQGKPCGFQHSTIPPC